MPATILAFDTSGPHIAIGLWPGTTPSIYEEMAKGQAERLVPACLELLHSKRLTFADLDAVAVGVGPGNFTGLRIGVSAARGIALALKIPAVGVTGFEWLLQGRVGPGAVMISLPAPRDQAYVQTFINQKASSEPRVIRVGEHDPAFEHPNLLIAGYRADDIAAPIGAACDPEVWTERAHQTLATSIGRIASEKLGAAKDGLIERPAPLYIKPPDAEPSRVKAPTILG